MRRPIIPLTLAVALISCLVFAQVPRESDRSRAMVPYKIGFENMHAEKWAEAAKAFQGAIEIDPTFDLAWYMLGRVRMQQHEYVQAVLAFSRTRDLALALAGHQFTDAQERQRSRRDRVMEIDEVLRELRQRPPTVQALDQIRQVEEKKRELQENIDAGNDINVDTTVPAYVSLSLGSAYYRVGNRAEAEKYYKEALATDPRSGEAHNNLAVVYFETGRAEDADREVQAAEKVGFKVHPQLKADIKAAKKKTG